jgi:hypothetical protein
VRTNRGPASPIRGRIRSIREVTAEALCNNHICCIDAFFGVQPLPIESFPGQPCTKAGIQLHQALVDSGSSLRYGRNDAFRRETDFFSTLLSCSLSRVQTQLFVSAAAEGGWLIGTHGRRQDPKTPVEQALMRGLVTA